MNIIGINAFNHDPSVSLIKDGKVCCAIEEEKISREKHFTGFPSHALNECFELSKLKRSEIDIVAIPRDHKLEIRSHILHMMQYFPGSLNLLLKDSAVLPSEVKRERYLNLKQKIKTEINPRAQIVEVSHHESHAASVLFQSTYKKAAIIVADGIAEYDTIWIGRGENGKISKESATRFPHSLGMAYASVTDFLGFRPFDDEWKVMGMAAYGKPKYYEELSDLIRFEGELEIKLNQKVFAFHKYGKKKFFNDSFKLMHLRRSYGQEIKQEHFDFASSFQAVFEDKLMQLVRNVRQRFPEYDNVCLSGGVFLNCLFNGKLAQEGIYKNVYVDCNPGDAGSALGAAVLAHQNALGHFPASLNHSNSLGRDFTTDQIRTALQSSGLKYHEMGSVKEAASHLSNNKLIGLFQGRAEFGPRALGSRSIVADARSQNNKELINSKVKYREAFRPFAPSVLVEDQGKIFPDNVFSPYMSFAVRAKLGANDLVPAVIHEDNTARIQSVGAETSPFFHELISSYKENTGVSLVLNTSYNIRGEPIVYSPSDAIQTFRRANLDFLLMPPFIASLS